jgi:hypothetical protein
LANGDQTSETFFFYDSLELSQLLTKELSQLWQALLGVVLLVHVCVLVDVLLKAVENQVCALLLDQLAFVESYLSLNDIHKEVVVYWFANGVKQSLLLLFGERS